MYLITNVKEIFLLTNKNVTKIPNLSCNSKPSWRRPYRVKLIYNKINLFMVRYLRAMRFELILEWLKVTYFTVKLSSLFSDGAS